MRIILSTYERKRLKDKLMNVIGVENSKNAVKMVCEFLESDLAKDTDIPEVEIGVTSVKCTHTIACDNKECNHRNIHTYNSSCKKLCKTIRTSICKPI